MSLSLFEASACHLGKAILSEARRRRIDSLPALAKVIDVSNANLQGTIAGTRQVKPTTRPKYRAFLGAKANLFLPPPDADMRRHPAKAGTPVIPDVDRPTGRDPDGADRRQRRTATTGTSTLTVVASGARSLKVPPLFAGAASRRVRADTQLMEPVQPRNRSQRSTGQPKTKTGTEEPMAGGQATEVIDISVLVEQLEAAARACWAAARQLQANQGRDRTPRATKAQHR
jgi:hypothetical protein